MSYNGDEQRPCAEDERPCAEDDHPCAVDERLCAEDERPCAEGERPCAEVVSRRAEERVAADACLLPLRSKGCTNRFEDSTEWKWTKQTCAGLFRALGRYYDELWFPTVILEWCMLYYRCSHSCDYWQQLDAWLEGDDQVRVAVWSQVLDQRTRRDRQMRDGCAEDDVDDQRRTVDPARVNDAGARERGEGGFGSRVRGDGVTGAVCR